MFYMSCRSREDFSEASVARVPEDELERLKREVSLQRLVEAKGIELRKHGAGGDLIGSCPFHDDREPSFVVSVERNLWCCHGACQVGGSVVDFVMRAEGVSFRHAVDLLRVGVGSGPIVGGVPRQSTVRKLAPIAPVDAEDAVLLARVVAFYAETLKESCGALAEQTTLLERWGWWVRLARRRIDPHTPTTRGRDLLAGVVEDRSRSSNRVTWSSRRTPAPVRRACRPSRRYSSTTTPTCLTYPPPTAPGIPP